MIKPLMSKTILFSLVIISSTILTLKSVLTADYYLYIIMFILGFKAGDWAKSNKKEID